MSSCSQVRDNTQIKTDSKTTKFQFAPLKSNVSQPFFHYHHALALKRDTLLLITSHIIVMSDTLYITGMTVVVVLQPSLFLTGTTLLLVFLKLYQCHSCIICYHHYCHSKGHLFKVPLLGGKKFHLEKCKQNIILHLQNDFYTMEKNTLTHKIHKTDNLTHTYLFRKYFTFWFSLHFKQILKSVCNPC